MTYESDETKAGPIPKGMRTLHLAIFVIGMVSAAAPAQAQTFPVCLRTYGIVGDNLDCSYASTPQCNASASGLAAQCLTNPIHILRARESPRVIGGIAAP